MAKVQIADVVVPEIFEPYSQQLSMQKSALIQSGAVAVDAQVSEMMAGGGITFNLPSFRDLEDTDENVSSDTGSDSVPEKTSASQEIGVRLSRNKSWSSTDLVADLAGVDPMESIAQRISNYWARRYQHILVATLMGVFADNAAAPTGGDLHVQNDLTHNVSGGGYTAGLTDFSAEATIETFATAGDAQDILRLCLMHSVVFTRAQKNNLIDYIPDAEGRISIPTYLGKPVIVDDGMPNPAGAGAAQTASGIFHTWFLGEGALRLGFGMPKVPVEVDRKPEANNGGGEETLFNRKSLCLHPTGHAFIGNLVGAPGGPSNLATSGNLAHADSWSRVYPERKQIRMARLITREY